MRLPLLVLLLLFLPGCASTHQAAPAPASDASVSYLRECLTGFFTSQAQAAADPDYRDIRLHMAPIWTDRIDGPWLYVEQALASDEGRPYRQRIYRLSALNSDTFQSEIFELSDTPDGALAFAGAWNNAALLAGISPADLKPKQGCEVILKWFPAEHAFKGSTLGANCTSAFRGAAYATSEIALTEGLLTSWDRGFSTAGKQVWGADKGGYRFVRQP